MSLTDHQVASDHASGTEASQAAEKMRRFATVVRDSNDAITIQDFQGRITAWNRGAELMYGYSEEEALVANIERLTAPGKVAEQKDFIRRLIAGEAITSFETQRVTKDGRVLDVWMTVTKLMDEAGKPVGLASTERDITERKRTENALRESNDYLENLINHANAPIIVWDPQFRITRFNHAFESLTGRRADEVIGKSLELLFPPASVEGSIALIKKTTGGERWETVEISILHLDGSIHTVLWNSATLFTADGKAPVATIAQGMDITERIRAAEKMRRMATVVRDSNDAITIQDFQGRITAWNRGAELMYGYSEEEALAANIERLTAPGKIAEQKDFTRRLIAGEAITSFETQRVTKDGRVLDVWMTVTKLMDEAGKPVGLASTERDITERKRRENALRESNDYMENLINHANAPIIVWDPQFRITRFNHAFESLAGRSADTVIGKSMEILFPLSLLESSMELIKKTLAGERMETVEVAIQHRDGPVRTVLWNSATIFAPDGKTPVATIAQGQDITERKRAEAALVISEERFRIATDSLTDVVYDWDIKEKVDWYGDIDGIMGYPPGGFPRTIKGWAATIHPEDKDRVIAALEDHLKGVAPYVVEYRVGRKDGQWRLWSARGTALRDDRGEPYKMIGSITDITERKRAEEALRENEARYRTLVESIPQKILMKDRNCRWVSINKNLARDFGFPPENVVGKMDTELFTPELAAKYHADDVRIMETGQTEELEEKYLLEGRETWVNTIKTPVRGANGEIVGVLGIFWDITKRKQAEEEIRQFNTDLEQRVRERTAQLETANKELEAFSYSVSHDLRAPLRHVQGYVDMLAREAEGRLSDKGRRYMKTIEDASREMGVLIDDLLAFARMGRAEMIETKVDLAALVRETLREMEPATHERNIVWKIPPLPAVQADPAMLKLALANLLGNAVKFTRPRDPAQIEIGCEGKDGERVIVFVRDNGVGFDPQYTHKLFGVFQRLHCADEFEGTGIGLASVRRIIARHGGRTWAEGRLNEGATFYFTLKASKIKNAE